METLDCIKTRASARGFKRDRIPDDMLGEILAAATQAPSAGNVQDWEFVVVTKQETKQRLAESAWGQGFIAEAPAVIVVCSNLRAISNAYGERGKSLYSIQDAAAATQNLMLAAWDRKIGSCWVGSFNEEKVREALVLPATIRPLAIIPLGYPSSKPSKTERKALDEVVHREFY